MVDDDNLLDGLSQGDIKIQQRCNTALYAAADVANDERLPMRLDAQEGLDWRARIAARNCCRLGISQRTRKCRQKPRCNNFEKKKNTSLTYRRKRKALKVPAAQLPRRMAADGAFLPRKVWQSCQ
jgi:hypothetical protein